ncbi:MAG: divalent metal cation transporter [Dehalococcoidia bacterium]|nr:divalent metal cation transporter [Dehalococcoidia bacterium]
MAEPEPKPPAARGRLALRISSWHRLAFVFAILGPGFITGVADDDAPGITGYSIAGAHYGYDLLWALALTLVGLSVCQEMVARMGAVTGKGLSDLIRERFGVRITLIAMTALLVANATTTIAEFAGIAAASELFGVSRLITIPIAAVVIFGMVVWGTYRRVEIILMAISTVFVAYVITGFKASPEWGDVARGALVPTMKLDVGYLTVLIGLIGTTIAPWGQFYLQAAVVDKGLGVRDLKHARADAYVGAFVTNFIAFFIIITTAATLYVHGKPADTITDVADSLRPLAGDFGEKLFALGLLNASLMAAAVLPLSTAYAICEAFGWERSVSRPLREAPAFFALFGGLILLAAVAVLAPGVPLLVLLFLPNVVGAMLLPIILVLTLLLVNDRRLMGSHANGRGQNLVGWGTTVALMILTTLFVVAAFLEVFGVIG